VEWDDWMLYGSSDAESDFDDDSDEDRDEKLIGKSPLEHLELIRCSADDPALDKLLNFPMALKTLHFDLSPQAWAKHYRGVPRRGPYWSGDMFVRVLEPHYDTLEELTMTESEQDGLGMAYQGDQADLSVFSALRVVRIHSIFLFPMPEELDPVWELLPKSLEELEVYYHVKPNSKYDGLFRGWSDRAMYFYDIPGWWPGAHFFELLQARRAKYNKLRKVTICTPESHPAGSAGPEHVPSHKNNVNPLKPRPSNASARKVFNWPLPPRVARLAKSAGVELKILLERENPSFDDFDALDVVQGCM
jgi:hypothetical protein